MGVQSEAGGQRSRLPRLEDLPQAQIRRRQRHAESRPLPPPPPNRHTHNMTAIQFALARFPSISGQIVTLWLQREAAQNRGDGGSTPPGNISFASLLPLTSSSFRLLLPPL